MAKRQISPLKAIRLKCLDCAGGSFSEVKNCEIETCPLYYYRFGKKHKLVRGGYRVEGVLQKNPRFVAEKN